MTFVPGPVHPLLRRADIGVAMGRSGTDVAREAATMVLTDDNFATIVTAVRAARIVCDNVRPVAGHPMRVEDYISDGNYIVRAELPGIDPEKDVEVTVTKGILTIKAERREEVTGKHHSEFSYGTFSRSVTLPASADEEQIEAVYGHGILEVTVKLADKGADKAARKIPVRQNQHIKPT